MLRRGPTSAGTGTDHKETAKHNRNNVAIETAVRKRMMECTSNIMGSDRVREEGHENCQRDAALEVRESKKRNEIKNAWRAWRSGTGTQIVH